MALTTERKTVLVHTSWLWVEFGFGSPSGIILQNPKEYKLHLFNIWLTFIGYFEQWFCKHDSSRTGGNNSLWQAWYIKRKPKGQCKLTKNSENGVGFSIPSTTLSSSQGARVPVSPCALSASRQPSPSWTVAPIASPAIRRPNRR